LLLTHLTDIFINIIYVTLLLHVIWFLFGCVLAGVINEELFFLWLVLAMIT